MNLRSVGLNKFEDEAYQALVRIGKGTAAQVATASGVPSGRIYDVLESLITKGLVNVSPEKPKMYIPVDPSALKEIIEDKIMELKKVEKEVSKLKVLHETRPGEAVWLTKGKKNFYRIVKALPESKKSVLSIKYTAEFKPEWARDCRKNMRKGVDYKILTRYDAETKDNVHKWLKINKNHRSIANDGIVLSIQDDDSMFITMINSEVTLVFRDRPFIKLMKDLFLAYWEKAERIKPSS